jgi:hypothetical protein
MLDHVPPYSKKFAHVQVVLQAPIFSTWGARAGDKKI